MVITQGSKGTCQRQMPGLVFGSRLSWHSDSRLWKMQGIMGLSRLTEICFPSEEKGGKKRKKQKQKLLFSTSVVHTKWHHWLWLPSPLGFFSPVLWFAAVIFKCFEFEKISLEGRWAFPSWGRTEIWNTVYFPASRLYAKIKYWPKKEKKIHVKREYRYIVEELAILAIEFTGNVF